MMLRVGVTCGLLIALFGCAAAPQDRPDDPQAAWERRQVILTRQQTWALSGKLAVHAEQEGWFAGLNWWQDGEQFQVDLKDSFGRIVARIEGDENEVALTQQDGSKITAATPEQLTRELYGWTLPLSGLRYWVLGAPAPGDDSTQREEHRVLDNYGRLTELHQAGWIVEYQQYQDLEPVALPEKISVSGHDLRLKLIVEEWETTGISAQLP